MEETCIGPIADGHFLSRNHAARSKLILLGTGFAAFSFMRHVYTKLYDLVVVSPRNHFLFTPLLPSTTVGTIEFRSIIEPIRVALGRKPFTYYQARCIHINPDTRLITCEGALDNQTFLLCYNVLVVAVGAVNRTFGIPGVTEHALFLKELADGSTLPYGLVVWSTGIEAAPLVQALPFPKDRAGRLATDDYFCVDPAQSIYAIGDCATRSGVELPATAQVAQQEGEYLAKVLNARAKGRPPRKFKYRNLGMLAYIGDNRALADLPHIKGRGFTTWLFWRSAYVTKLVSFKNKVLVLFDWFKTLIFGRDISRF